MIIHQPLSWYWIIDQSWESETLDNLQQEVDIIIDSIHEAPDHLSKEQENRNLLCITYQSWCDRTEFALSTIELKKKLYYQTLLVYTIKKIESFGIDLHHVIESIVIKSSSSTSRWYSSRNTLTLDIKAMRTYKEFMNVLIHELGHFVDLSILVWTPTMPKSDVFTEFNRRMFSLDDPSLSFYQLSRSDESTRLVWATYKDFVSWYGMKDPFEDFSETMHMYINYNQILQEMTKQSPILFDKYVFMDNLFQGSFISSWSTKKSLFESYNRDFRPYDSTRF